MPTFSFPEEAIATLRADTFDPGAQLGYELLSGALFWSDEHFAEFVAVCRAKNCAFGQYPFAYRTSLIENKPRIEMLFAWEELMHRCPSWIGFRPERVSPSPELVKFLRGCENDEW
jgi:hypothetical protein